MNILETAFQNYQFLAVLVTLLFLAILGYGVYKLKFYSWYFAIFLCGLLVALLRDGSQNPMYFYAFLIGVLVAFSEIIGKFTDEPIKSLKTTYALIYHVANGLIAVFALKWLFLNNGNKVPEGLDSVKYVLSAGIGSMAILRSKIFTMKVGNEDIAFGPEQLVTVYFRFMETAMSRVRAKARIDFIEQNLKNIQYDMLYNAALVMIDSLGGETDYTKKLKDDYYEKNKPKTEKVTTEKISDEVKQLETYKFGFFLLNLTGEDFITRLVAMRTKEWNISNDETTEKKETKTAVMKEAVDSVRQIFSYRKDDDSQKAKKNSEKSKKPVGFIKNVKKMFRDGENEEFQEAKTGQELKKIVVSDEQTPSSGKDEGSQPVTNKADEQ